MRKPPKIRRPVSIFRQRIIVTVPPWAVPVFSFAVCAAIVYSAQMVATAICVMLTFLAAVAVYSAYRQVNEIRHQMHNILHDIENLEFNKAPEPVLKSPTSEADRLANLSDAELIQEVRESAPRRISVRK